MSRQPSLRPQLNQVRSWVRQGRTDAWIAHQLDVSIEQLGRFKRDHGLSGEASRPEPPPPLGAEDAVLVEARAPAEQEAAAEQEAVVSPEPLSDVAPAREARDGESQDSGPAPRRRRRQRRGRRGGAKRGRSYEATFDHGEEGYGLWLDPAVTDDSVYREHWAGHRAVTVTLEADAITIRRTGID